MKFLQYRRQVIKLPIILFCLFLADIAEGWETREDMEDQANILMDFTNPEEATSWMSVNDGVMGGVSQSKVAYQNNGTFIFQGVVSLENNGGFASTRKNVESLDFAAFSGVMLQVKGDGKDYQLRLRMDNRFDGISYRHRFQTKTGSAQIITMKFADFEPVFRGRILNDAPPLNAENIQQLGVLIADNQAGEFKLEIDWIKGVK